MKRIRNRINRINAISILTSECNGAFAVQRTIDEVFVYSSAFNFVTHSLTIVIASACVGHHATG